MKKTKVIALVLCAAIMLMGAGYAYWSDTLTINNTVATGEFKVEFIDDQFYPKIFGASGETYTTKTIVQNDAKTTTVEIGNMYPGRNIRYELKIQNNGTVPAVFDNAVVTFDPTTTEALKTKMLGQFGHYKHHADGTGYSGAEGGGITGFFPLVQLQEKLNQRLAGVRLEPGEFLTFDIPPYYYEEMKLIDPTFNPEDPQCISFELPTSVVNEDNVEKATAKFSITVNWKQHNK
jgi:predicted ribosomally synthesized peptide with SipW-like signal peptide